MKMGGGGSKDCLRDNYLDPNVKKKKTFFPLRNQLSVFISRQCSNHSGYAFICFTIDVSFTRRRRSVFSWFSIYVTNQYPFIIVSRRGWHHLAYINVWQITLPNTKEVTLNCKVVMNFLYSWSSQLKVFSAANGSGSGNYATNADCHTSNNVFISNKLIICLKKLYICDTPDQIKMAEWLPLLIATYIHSM